MRQLLALPLLLSGGLAHAADEVATDYWVRVLPSLWFAQARGDASYGTNNASPTTFSTDGIGLGDREPAFMIEAAVKVPFLFGVHAGTSAFATDGGATLGGNLTFADRTFTAGTAIATDLTLRDLWAEVCIRPLSLDIAGVSIGLAVHQLTTELTISGGGQSARFSEAPLVPVVAVRGHVNLPFVPGLGVELKLHTLSIPLPDLHPSYLDADLHVAWRPWELLGFTAGYRYVRWDIGFDDPSGSGSSADLALTLAGPYLGLIAKF
jgi:hypothetical protein